MVAHYDNYNYSAYWEGRDYEHESEVLAIRELLKKIPKVGRVADMGCGYGRLVPTYAYRANSVTLTDPSGGLLKLARSDWGDRKNFNFVQASIEKLPAKFRGRKFDLILIVRVCHHLKDLDLALGVVHKLLKRGGYFILEFPNKNHTKAILTKFLRGDFTYPLDIFPKYLGKSKQKNEINFKNYHPGVMMSKLEELGFEIIQRRSVSNLRSGLVKNIVPTRILLMLERILQVLFGAVNFGPSVILLAKKVK